MPKDEGSKERGATGTNQVERRTWDKDKYERRARDRLEHGDEFVDGEKEKAAIRNKEEFRGATAGAAGPAGSARAFLQSRGEELDLEAKAGKTQVLTDATMHKKAGGWWCDVCECLLRDSANYLDHINGKKHQRALGFSMRVERVDVCQVVDRFKAHKRAAEEREENASKPRASASDEYAERLAAREADEQETKRARKEEWAAKKEAAQREREAEQAHLAPDDDIAAMMGFGGFGGGAKKK